MTHKEALSYCRYYNGEAQCPFDLKSRQSRWWDIEETWVKLVIPDEYRFNSFCNEFLDVFPDGMPVIKSVPISLKATLYDQHLHWGGTRDSFEDILFTYLHDIP